MTQKIADAPSPLANLSSCAKIHSSLQKFPVHPKSRSPGRHSFPSTGYCWAWPGRKTYKYALTVVDVASRFKEAEPLTSKESAEVARCFQKIYKRGPLRWPQFCKWTQGASSWELSPKRWKNKWNDLAKEIWLWCAEQNIWLTAVHVPGVKNVEADRQSRLPHSSLEWTLDNTVFKDCISERNVLPTIDLFASRISHQLPNYVSWHPNPGAVAIDALYLSWKECVP